MNWSSSPAMVLSFIISRRSSREMLSFRIKRSPLICGVIVGSIENPAPDFRGQLLHAGIVESRLLHQDVGHRDLEPLRDHETNRVERAIERSLNLRDRVVNLGTMGVDADLHGLDAKLSNQRGFLVHESGCRWS